MTYQYALYASCALELFNCFIRTHTRTSWMKSNLINRNIKQHKKINGNLIETWNKFIQKINGFHQNSVKLLPKFFFSAAQYGDSLNFSQITGVWWIWFVCICICSSHTYASTQWERVVSSIHELYGTRLLSLLHHHLPPTPTYIFIHAYTRTHHTITSATAYCCTQANHFNYKTICVSVSIYECVLWAHTVWCL